jgi:hypothetical protein
MLTTPSNSALSNYSGKVTEIAAFTERRETVHVHDAQTLRDKLMHSLRMVADAQTVDYQDADSLLAEIGNQATEAPGETLTPLESLPGETPPAPDPQDFELRRRQYYV